MKKIIYLTFAIVLFLTGCSISSPEPQVEVEWSDVVKWNNDIYSFDEVKSRQKEYREADKEVGVIAFSLVGSKQEKNPKYQLKNGEATFAGKGSKIYSIKGMPTEKLILVQNKVYRVRD
ncbi:membrane lipoprotein lipid attachment site-containing protein [Rossellomorea aquimaris]|uniref:membrane lipoprotein lipid attachment site-containing protein n=1 Tax=Rossellomorea aquimaris TaxID=189382 RepID=UPI0007D0AEA9|nr:membrane lipoprotein lipid attachment site-containing protein [Rossellomorea aquimaris]